MSISVVIYDSNPPRKQALSSSFHEIGCDVCFLDNGRLTAFNGVAFSQGAGVKWRGCLALVHTSDEPVNGDLVDLTDALQICYSTAPTHGREFGIPREVSASNPLTREQCQALVALLQVELRDRKKAFDTIWSGVPESVLSWALLKSYGHGEPDVALRKAAEEEYSVGRKQVLGQTQDAAKEAIEARLQQRFSLEGAKALIAELRADL